jgi:hypothetical protein
METVISVIWRCTVHATRGKLADIKIFYCIIVIFSVTDTLKSKVFIGARARRICNPKGLFDYRSTAAPVRTSQPEKALTLETAI